MSYSKKENNGLIPIPLDRMEIMEGKSVALECELSDADANVLWYKNKRPVMEDDRISIETEGPKRRLTIKNATKEDSGLYSCETGEEQDRTICFVSIRQGDAHITFSPQDFHCTAFGEKVAAFYTMTNYNLI